MLNSCGRNEYYSCVMQSNIKLQWLEERVESQYFIVSEMFTTFLVIPVFCMKMTVVLKAHVKQALY